MKSPWDTIIQVLVCELDIEEYAKDSGGAISSAAFVKSCGDQTQICAAAG